MKRYVARNAKGGVYQVMGTLDARFSFRRASEKITSLAWWLLFVSLISPLGAIAIFTYMVTLYYKEIHSVFFIHKEVEGKYKSIFSPLVDKQLFCALGYRVYPEELEAHLSLVNSSSEEDIQNLMKKGSRMRKDMARQFGFNIDKATRHSLLLGTTGAGKTETLMSFFVDVIKSGSGIGMIDGKSDQEIQFKIYNLCKENYYETQFYAIIFNKPEKGTESNTYAPLLGYESAMKASEFLGEFLGGGGDGSKEYFTNRGKVLMGYTMMHFKNRQKFYNENFSLSDLSSSYSLLELNNIYYMAHGIISDIESLIRTESLNNGEMRRLLKKAKGYKTVQYVAIENTEVMVEYLRQNPQQVRSIEKILGLKYQFVYNYYMLYNKIGDYMQEISPSWIKYVKPIASAIYLYYSEENKSFLYTDKESVSLSEIRTLYSNLKDENKEEYQAVLLLHMEEPSKVNLLCEALGLRDTAENAETIRNESLIQHNYAQQQWTRLFSLFQEYAGILGTSYPDVEMEDVLSNGKVLFEMIPVQELATDQTEVLGKMGILKYKMLASLALGGDKQNATPIQFKIYQNKIKPNPIFFVVFDEVGAYITVGMSYLLSQVRSLRISVWLSMQDLVSARPSGSEGEKEQSRILGNLSKIVAGTRDGDITEFEKMIPEVEIIESEGYMHSAQFSTQ
ncbi:MAG TPA: hypothetical protein EYP60_06625, partial [bacterium (Candidatus Stahlbacteria)]|nr:hypothetical protein [Candidatus Stahlbacteria bacterium]